MPLQFQPQICVALGTVFSSQHSYYLQLSTRSRGFSWTNRYANTEERKTMPQSDLHQLYSQLPQKPGKIFTRLLQLQPRPNADDTEILDCSLQLVDVHNAPEYDALSYAWGNEDRTRTIRVNGIGLTVTQNLERALRNLRQTSKSRMLWADAVCINQNDLEERSAQVAQMHVIFHNAKQTVSWLGDDGENGEHALKFLQW